MKQITLCPVCRSSSFITILDTKDFFLTHEPFTVVQCERCLCGLTNPQPEKNELPAYYHSETYISHTPSGKSILNTLYLLVRKYTVRKKYRLVRSLSGLSTGAILDIGCGSGELLHMFKRNQWTTTGIEPAEDPRNNAIRKYNLNVGDSDLLNNLESRKYDVVMCWHSLEHIENLNETLVQIKRLLATHGILIVALPNHQAWDASCYGTFWAGWDVPRHLYHFSIQSVHELMLNHGLNIIKKIPMKLDAYYVSMLSEKYKHGKINYMAALKNGCRSNRYARTHDQSYSSIIYVMKHEIP